MTNQWGSAIDATRHRHCGNCQINDACRDPNKRNKVYCCSHYQGVGDDEASRDFLSYMRNLVRSESVLVDPHGIDDMPTYGGVYLIHSPYSGRCYVGSSKNLKRRLQRHFNELRKNQHHSLALQLAYNKFGEKLKIGILLKFNGDILSIVRIKLEQFFIDNLNSVYNSSKFARSPMLDPKVVSRVSDTLQVVMKRRDVRRKLSKKTTAYFAIQENRDHHSNMMKKAFQKPETLLRARNSQLGKHHSKKTRRIISYNSSQYWADLNNRKNQSIVLKNHYAEEPFSQERCDNHSNGAKRRWEDIKERNKQSDRIKKALQDPIKHKNLVEGCLKREAKKRENKAIKENHK